MCVLSSGRHPVRGARVTSVAALAVVALSVVGPRAALAQDDFAPSTLTLDRMDATHRLGIQLGFNKLPADFALRGELYGQLLLPGRTLGFYGQMPFSRTFIEGTDYTGIGNVEAGTFYLPGGTTGLLLRAGLAFGTGSNFPDAIANLATYFERLTDLVAAAPRTTALRLSASTVRQLAIFFFRADLGFDIVLDNDSTTDILLRANVAAGLRLPYVDLAGELVNLGRLDGPDGSASERFFHTFAVSLRTRGVNQLSLGYITPLDSGARGDLWTVALGYQRAFP